MMVPAGWTSLRWLLLSAMVPLSLGSSVRVLLLGLLNSFVVHGGLQIQEDSPLDGLSVDNPDSCHNGHVVGAVTRSKLLVGSLNGLTLSSLSNT